MTEKLLVDNYKRVTENIRLAKTKAGRAVSDTVRIMAVTKTIDTERINAALSCGVDLLGENRVQEFLQKKPDYTNCRDYEIHFIGGLQTNKVRQIITQVSVIQSLDSAKLAHEIDRQAALNGLIMDVLIQVNISGEPTKNGISPHELSGLIQETDKLSGIRLRGLMTIPPPGDGERYFEKMQRLFEDLKSGHGNPHCDTLSMGMSGDYEKAVEYGATIVRLGTALFGQRN